MANLRLVMNRMHRVLNMSRYLPAMRKLLLEDHGLILLEDGTGSLIEE